MVAEGQKVIPMKLMNPVRNNQSFQKNIFQVRNGFLMAVVNGAVEVGGALGGYLVGLLLMSHFGNASFSSSI